MKLDEVKTLGFGAFRVHWKNGGSSIAAIGNLSTGERWIAPINFLTPTHLTDKVAESIQNMELITRD